MARAGWHLVSLVQKIRRERSRPRDAPGNGVLRLRRRRVAEYVFGVVPRLAAQPLGGRCTEVYKNLMHCHSRAHVCVVSVGTRSQGRRLIPLTGCHRLIATARLAFDVLGSPIPPRVQREYCSSVRPKKLVIQPSSLPPRRRAASAFLLCGRNAVVFIRLSPASTTRSRIWQ